MALKTIVKLSNASNLSDARYAAGMGVDMIGFTIDPASDDYVSPQKFKEITEWIAGPLFVGEFPGDQLTVNPEYNNLHYLQLSDPDHINEARNWMKNIIMEINLNNLQDMDAVNDLMRAVKLKVNYFLLTNNTNQLGQAEMDLLNAWGTKFPILLDFGINEHNINELASNKNIKGISLKGESESIPGFKDYDHLASILEKLEIEENKQL